MKRAILFIFALAITFSSFAAKISGVKPEGEGTEESPYLFTQVENFGWLAGQRDNIDAGTTVYCVQINDIDASRTKDGSFPGIVTENVNGKNRGMWTLNYDGQGFNIEDAYIGGSESHSAIFSRGFFQLKNINIVRAHNQVFDGMTLWSRGILVGLMGRSGYIKNCHIRDTKISSGAGLVGDVICSDLEISDCSVDAELPNSSAGLIRTVRNYGTVVIRNTSVKAKIALDAEETFTPAGFINWLELYEGGVKTVIEDCYADIEVSSPNPYVGTVGFIGYIGNLRRGEQVDFSINRCYSTGTPANMKLWASASFLQRVYDCEPVINSCYYNATTLLKEDKYAIPKTEEELKHQATFEGWDFEKVWAIDEGNGLPYLRMEIPEEYPELNVKYKGQGECTVENGVITITGGSYNKDTLSVTGVNGECRVKRIIADRGLKKIKVAGDLEGLQVAGQLGTLFVNGGNLGKEGQDFALIFDASQATIKVKATKRKDRAGSKAGLAVVGGNVKGNILCGTRDKAGKITTLGTVKKLVTLGGNIENGKLVAEKIKSVIAKPKDGKGGQIIDFKTETN